MDTYNLVTFCSIKGMLRQSPLMSEKRRCIGPYSGTQRHNALHNAQCIVNTLLMPHVRNFSWHMDAWKFRPRNRKDFLQLLQAPVRTSGGFKNIKDLLITKLCIITSDKLCKF